jgi:hypothetical protein
MLEWRAVHQFQSITFYSQKFDFLTQYQTGA